jgi:hypothetical protein
MFSKQDHSTNMILGLRLRAGAFALVSCASLLAAGCASSIKPHATALAAATAPVVDQATAAYQTAQAIHAQSVDFNVATDFEKTGVFIPGSVQEWPSNEDIQVRLAVLTAFQLYVKDLVAITGGTSSPALDAASKSMGNSLASLANTLAPSAESALGITTPPASTTQTTVTTTTGSTTTTTTSTSTTPPPLISGDAAKGISTAINALGQFLINRTIEKELPQQVEAMDPHVQALCELLAKDIGLLQEQEKIDSNNVIDKQTDFVRTPGLDPEERRVEFMKLPEMARQQRANNQKLTQLRMAILRLELTHHALAAAAQGNNPESLKERLGDVETAGESLGKFYSSLSPAQ